MPENHSHIETQAMSDSTGGASGASNSEGNKSLREFLLQDPGESVRVLRQNFAQIDTDRSGLISQAELKIAETNKDNELSLAAHDGLLLFPALANFDERSRGAQDSTAGAGVSKKDLFQAIEMEENAGRFATFRMNGAAQRAVTDFDNLVQSSRQNNPAFEHHPR